MAATRPSRGNIRHLRETLRLRGAAEAAAALQASLAQAAAASSLDTLNGVEGAATRAFFQAAAGLLDAAWGFAGRNRRPPQDPFNALLSFGYTLLHGYVETLLHADGWAFTTRPTVATPRSPPT